MKITFYSLVFCLVFIGCEFPLKKENFVEISPIPKNDIKIDLRNLPDTLEVIEDVKVSYSLSIAGSTPIAIFIVFDGKSNYFGYNPSGDFVISRNLNVKNKDTRKYFPFEFVVVSTSQTGSLADRNQKELIVFSVKKTLYFDYTPTKALDFKSADDSKGTILLSWDKYPYKNLRSIKLKKTIRLNGSNTPFVEIWDLEKTATSYQDKAFVGAEIEYQLITENNINQQATGASARFSYQPSAIKEFKTIDYNKLQIKWNKTKLYNNAVGYQIRYLDKVISSININDSIAILNDFPFGNSVDVVLQTVSKNSYLSSTTRKNLWLGKKSITAKRIIDYPGKKMFFYLDSPFLIKADENRRDSIYLDFDNDRPAYMSPKGESLYLSSSSDIIEVATSDLKIKSTFSNNLPEYYYSFLPFGNKYFVLCDFFCCTKVARVYDRASNEITQTFYMTDTPDSPGGAYDKYITKFIETSSKGLLLGEGQDFGVFTVGDDGTIKTANFVDGNKGFLSRDEKYVYVYSNYDRKKYTFPSLELVSGSSISTPFIENLQFSRSNYLYGQKVGSSYEIRDLETNTLKRKIILTPSAENQFIGGFLFATQADVTFSLDLNF